MFRGSKTILAFSWLLALGQCQTLLAGSHEGAATPPSPSNSEAETKTPGPNPEAEQAEALYDSIFVDGNQAAKKDGRYAIEETDSFKSAALYLLGDQNQKDFSEKDVMIANRYLGEALLKLEQSNDGEDAQAIARLKLAVTRGMQFLKLAEPSSTKPETDPKVPPKMGDLAKQLAEKDSKTGELMKKLFATQIEITQKAEDRLKAGKESEIDRAIIDARKALGEAIRSLLGDPTLKAPEGRDLVAALTALKAQFNNSALMKSLTDEEYEQLKKGISKGEALILEHPYQWSSGENIRKLMDGANALYKLAWDTLFGTNETGKDQAAKDAHNKALSDAYGAISDIIQDPSPKAKITEAERKDGLALADSFLDVSPQAHSELPRPIAADEEMTEQEAPQASRPKSDRESVPSTRSQLDERGPTEPNPGSSAPNKGSSKFAQMPPKSRSTDFDSKLASMLSSIGTTGRSSSSSNSMGQPSSLAKSSSIRPKTSAPADNSETSTNPKVVSQLLDEPAASSARTVRPSSAPVLAPQKLSESQTEKSSAADAGTNASVNSVRPSNTSQKKGSDYSGGTSWGFVLPARLPFDTAGGVASSESNLAETSMPNLASRGNSEVPTSNKGSVRSIGRTPNPNALKVDALYGAANGAAVSSPVTDNSAASSYSEWPPEEPRVRPTTQSLNGGNSTGSSSRETVVKPTQSQVAQASSILEPYIEKAKQWIGMSDSEQTEEQGSQRSLASIDTSPALRAAAKAVSDILKDNFAIAYNAPATFAPKQKASASSVTNAQQAVQKLLSGPTIDGDLTSFLKNSIPRN